MFKILSVAILILGVFHATFARRSDKREEKIVGGNDALITDYPYQAALEFVDLTIKPTPAPRHICGGALISKRHILTAARCLAEVTSADLKIRVGSQYLHKDGVLADVMGIEYHPKFQDNENDIGVVTLTKALDFSSTIQKVDLIKKRAKILGNNEANATGWGTTDEPGVIKSPKLKYVVLPIVDLTKCRAMINEYKLTDSMMCAGFKDGKAGGCQGDTGGPLVIDKKIVGVASWGVGCGRANKPGVYTKVSAFIPFIEKAMGKVP